MAKFKLVKEYKEKVGDRTLLRWDAVYESGRIASFTYDTMPKTVSEFIRNAKANGFVDVWTNPGYNHRIEICYFDHPGHKGQRDRVGAYKDMME